MPVTVHRLALTELFQLMATPLQIVRKLSFNTVCLYSLNEDFIFCSSKPVCSHGCWTDMHTPRHAHRYTVFAKQFQETRNTSTVDQRPAVGTCLV